MTTHSFVYSNNPRYRLLRHILFWIGWIIYFIAINSMRGGSSLYWLQRFSPVRSLEMLVLLSVDILFVIR
jgi:hypothetical protein